MSITLDLQPEVERGLLAQASARGVSLDEFVKEIVTREAQVPRETEQRTGQAFIDASARLRGLFTDEEVDTIFSRNRSSSSAEARNLAELFANSPFAGLNMDFERDRDTGREIEL